MNQTRTFLIFAWLVVATLLYMAWNGEHRPSAATTDVPVQTRATANPANNDGTIPQLGGDTLPRIPDSDASQLVGSSPAMGSNATSPITAAPIAAAPIASASITSGQITVTTDVLRAVLDGGSVRQADLLRYPETTAPGSPRVRLFAQDPAHWYQAQSGWLSQTGAAPTHETGFVAATDQRDYVLTAGARSVQVPFLWQGPDGVSIQRSYTFTRGSYAVQVRDEVINAGRQPWQGYVYRQLLRVPPQVKTGFTHPESYSFHGAAWFNDGNYEKRKFAKFEDGGALDQAVTGGWVAMLQHHFFAAWIPGDKDQSTVSLAWPQGINSQPEALIRELGPGVTVAPGARAQTSARLWVGPKLVDQIQAQHVRGLDRAVDFSSYGWLAWIAGVLFAVLSFLHGLFGNWGWAIIGLVVIIKALMYPLSAAQYKSAAKMRRFQPRIEQLKERYGEDKQKFQMAMMELYKKEKINPVGGCFPVLLQMPVFLALYWTLLESVELRQASWIGWIHNLTAPDPYFILPVINIAVMWATQKLTPTPGMDPMQKKMMQIMPLAMGVMFAFFPAGLVLYWVTNGSLGLLQQWWMTKRHGQPLPVKA